MDQQQCPIMLLPPALLGHALLFLDHVEVVRTASTCRAFRSLLLGSSSSGTAHLWRRLFRRRWLFGLRRRHRPRSPEAADDASVMRADFLAYRVRHQQARAMGKGQAGQFRVHTTRGEGEVTASLLESESIDDGDEGAKAAKPNAKDAGQSAEGPVAYLGIGTGLVARVGYDPRTEEYGPIFRLMWQAHIPAPPSPIVAIQREGNVLACGTADGRVVFLDAGTGATVGPPVIDTGLGPLTSLLWLEGGRRLAVGSATSARVKLYCAHTGAFCQEIGEPVDPEEPPRHSRFLPACVQALLKREEGGTAGQQRAHFLVLYHGQARFFVQNTVAETLNAAASVGAFRPYSEHGRVEAEACSPFTCAAIAPAVGGMPEDAKTGTYRVFLGSSSSGVKTAAFHVHERIRLAQLLHVGSIKVPLEYLVAFDYFTVDEDAPVINEHILQLKVHSVRVPSSPQSNAAGADHALLVVACTHVRVQVLSLHANAIKQSDDDDDYQYRPRFRTHVMMAPEGCASAVHVDGGKVVAAMEGHTQVFALPRLSSVSSDPESIPYSIDRDRQLYSLHGGSVTMGRPLEALGVAVGDAEIVVLYKDKLRLYDFAAT